VGIQRHSAVKQHRNTQAVMKNLPPHSHRFLVLYMGESQNTAFWASYQIKKNQIKTEPISLGCDELTGPHFQFE